MSLKIKNLKYILPNGKTLFNNISLNISNNEKISIIGKNGVGKSILLKLINKELEAYSGEIINNFNISYFHQENNTFNYKNIADIFGVEKEILALQNIQNNTATLEDYEILNNNWDISDKVKNKLKLFNLNFDLLQNFSTFSGGEKMKIILFKIINNNTNLVILDEPTNNLDQQSKEILFNFIINWKKAIIIVSHDRELLELADSIYELKKINDITELSIYGGNFNFFQKQKQIEINVLQSKYNESLKENKKQKQLQIENINKLNSKRKTDNKNRTNKKYVKVFLGILKMRSEKSRAKMKVEHNNQIEKSKQNIFNVLNEMEDSNKIYFKTNEDIIIKNKKILEIINLSFNYNNKLLFNNFNLILYSNDRLCVNGQNGSGKSTLLNIINKKIINYKGNIILNTDKIVYLDQNCELLDNKLNILNNTIKNSKSSELECRNILAQFLFRTDDVYKNIYDLSGGEKLRVALACSLINNPDLLLLDEPTNNLDLESINILENILNKYKGAIILISHDKYFKQNISIDKELNL